VAEYLLQSWRERSFTNKPASTKLLKSGITGFARYNIMFQSSMYSI
jgi:hypothetical protein